MEEFIQNIIRLHALLGGLGLISGIWAMAVKKGQSQHKLAGRIFSWTMVSSAALSLFVSATATHQSKFLFLIGIFTIYMVLSGNRVLTFKNSQKLQAQTLDYLVSGAMLIAALTMLFLGAYRAVYGINLGILYLFFGTFALLLSIGDLRFYRSCQIKRQQWAAMHIGRMMGALIAATTAFLVTAIAINSIWVWIAPTIFGTAFIFYQTRKWYQPQGTTKQ
jgi:uncharacterized membrane protein